MLSGTQSGYITSTNALRDLARIYHSQFSCTYTHIAIHISISFTLLEYKHNMLIDHSTSSSIATYKNHIYSHNTLSKLHHLYPYNSIQIEIQIRVHDTYLINLIIQAYLSEVISQILIVRSLLQLDRDQDSLQYSKHILIAKNHHTIILSLYGMYKQTHACYVSPRID